MDNPINSVDKSVPYPGTGAVKPLAQSEREKQRAFSDTLQETLDEEQERKKKAKHDAVVLEQQKDGDEKPAGDEWIPSDAEPATEPPEPDEDKPVPGDGRIDLTA